MNEVWKEINGWANYQVSNLGRIKSTKLSKEKILKLVKDGHGYLKVSLSADSWVRILKVHQLVAKAFIINSENKSCVLHKDGNSLNNNINNLYWGTPKENIHDSIKHGVFSGFKAKLNNKQVRVIKHCIKIGMRCRDIAKYFPVSISNIFAIKRGIIWKHITI